MASNPRSTPRAASRFRHGWIALVCLLLLLGGCLQAVTRGDEKPDEVVIAGTPTWTNGIAALMNLKCMVCHTVPRPDIAPDNTPGDLTLLQFGLVGTMRGAQDVIPALQAGIHQHPVASFPQMPLNYATPLTSGEAAALTTWAATTALPTISTTTAADGLILYAAYCQGCHGVHGTGRSAIAINTGTFATIRSSIDIGLTIPTMASWPGLVGLASTDLDAIATYLSSP